MTEEYSFDTAGTNPKIKIESGRTIVVLGNDYFVSLDGGDGRKVANVSIVDGEWRANDMINGSVYTYPGDSWTVSEDLAKNKALSICRQYLDEMSGNGREAEYPHGITLDGQEFKSKDGRTLSRFGKSATGWYAGKLIPHEKYFTDFTTEGFARDAARDWAIDAYSQLEENTPNNQDTAVYYTHSHTSESGNPSTVYYDENGREVGRYWKSLPSVWVYKTIATSEALCVLTERQAQHGISKDGDKIKSLDPRLTIGWTAYLPEWNATGEVVKVWYAGANIGIQIDTGHIGDYNTAVFSPAPEPKEILFRVKVINSDLPQCNYKADLTAEELEEEFPDIHALYDAAVGADFSMSMISGKSHTYVKAHHKGDEDGLR